MRARWARTVAVVAAATGLLAVACGGDNKGGSSTTTASGSAPTAPGGAATTAWGAATPSGGSSSGKTQIAIGTTLAPASLDITAQSGAAIPEILLYNVYETLVKTDDSGNTQPLLADLPKVSDDGLTYTFTLKDGVKFANGDPVKASDVVASFNRAKSDPKVVPLATSTFAPVSTITNPDDKTVVVTLTQRSRNFIYNLTQQGGVVYEAASIPDLATKAAGSGPFTVSGFTTGATGNLTLTRNDTYWGTKPALQTVTWRFFPDNNAMANAEKTGQIDIIDNLAPELFSQFKSNSTYETVEGLTNGETILALNNTRKPLDDVRVRQAISYAVDKEAVNQTAEQGYGKIIGSHASTNDPWFEDLGDTYKFDPAKAKDLLKQAGVSNLSLTLQVIPTPYAQAAAPVIVSNLKDVGINVTAQNIEFPLWLDQVFTKGDYDLTIVAHVEARDINLYSNPKYYWHYDSPKVQDLLKQADAAPTEAASNDLYKQVQEQINADAVNDWLFLLPRLSVIRKGITGYPKGGYT